MALPAILSIATPILKAGVNALSGGGGATSCPNQITLEEWSAILRNAPRSELTRLVNALNAAKPKTPYTVESLASRAAEATLGIAGGSDCKATSAAGQQLQAIASELRSKFGSSGSSFWQAELPPHPGTTQGGGSIFDGAPIGTVGATVPARGGQSTTEKVLDFFQTAGRDLFKPSNPASAPAASSTYWQPLPQQSAPTAMTLQQDPGGAGGSQQLLLVGGAVLLVVVVLVLLFTGGRK